MRLLLLLERGMSIRKWVELGQWSRELTIYSKLAEKIGEVIFYSYGYQEDEILKGYPTLFIISKSNKLWKYIPPNFSRRLNRFWDVWNLIANKELLKSIDIIKTNQFIASQWGSILRNTFKKKLVIRMGFYYTYMWDMGLISHEAKKFLKITPNKFFVEKKYFTLADGIITTSYSGRQYILKKYKIPPQKVLHLFNYVDCEVFRPLDINEKRIDILYVGRLHERKNLKMLIEAISKLNFSPTVLFIGKGREKEDLLRLAQQKNVSLEIIERVDNYKLPIYYNMSKLFVLPSYYEGNPKVLLEAMACGNVVIGTDVPGINDVIVDGETGFLAELSSRSLAEKIRDALLNYDHYRDTVGRKAREFILETSNLDRLIDKEVEFLKSL